MKKLLFAAAAIALMGAGCMSSTPTPVAPPIVPTPKVMPPVEPPTPESSEQNMPPQDNTTPPPPTPPVKPAPTTSTFNVTIENFAFAPASITVKQGDKIIVMNKDGAPHSMTADAGGSFDTGLLQQGKSATIDTSKLKPGTYAFHCSIHPMMTGTLIVK